MLSAHVVPSRGGTTEWADMRAAYEALDDATRTRIAGLAVPPAYADVWICADPRGHLQATSRRVGQHAFLAQQRERVLHRLARDAQLLCQLLLNDACTRSQVAASNVSQDGAVDLTVNGGTGPFSYLWSNTAISQDITGLGELLQPDICLWLHGDRYDVIIRISEDQCIQVIRFIQVFNR